MFTSSDMSELQIDKETSSINTPDYSCTKSNICPNIEIEFITKLIRVVFMKSRPVLGYINFIVYFYTSIHTINYGVYSCRKNSHNQNNKQLRSWIVTASLE